MQKTLSKELLSVLACPKCKSNLNYLKEKNKLMCANLKCKKNYLIENGIPNMLV